MQTLAPPPALADSRQFADYTPRRADHAERAVIGAIVQSEQALNEVAEILNREHFYTPLHQVIFDAALKLKANGGDINALELVGTFNGRTLDQTRNGVYLQECIASVPTAANGAHFARQVLAAAQLREAAAHAVRAMQLAASTPLDDVARTVELIRESAEKLGQTGSARPSWMTWEDLAKDVLDEVERIGDEAKKGVGPGGIPTGFSDLDRLLNHLQPGQVAVVAGRPGSGKTVLGLNIAQHAAMRVGVPAVIFSLEMSAVECGMRMMSAGSRVPLHAIRQGGLTDDDWTKIARYIGDTGEAPLFIDDTPSITMAHADAQMYRLEAMGIKPKVVVFDYLQLIEVASPSRSRQEDVASISRAMKLFAKKWGVTVILLAQLNRGPEQRTEKIPVLSDLRESGSVEQDADIVILIYRPDYYDKESPRAGEADFIIAKHRGGPTDTITVAAQLHLSRFVDMAII
ncbi:replicative DNA helicase [Micromonospora sp. NPDC049366]|uniref:replicative DNA helicase n=1 Tax=Micromonospora sp. NPDC049366 TaxID=3364271 RepID=UPI00378CD81A